MRLLYLLYIISAKVSSIKSSEYSSKGMIPSYDKIPVETVEMPDVLRREYSILSIPQIITRKSATNNK